MKELTEAQISEGIQNAAAATKHWLNGDPAAAFKVITYSESFPAAVHGLLALTGIAVAGSGVDTDRFLTQIALEAKADQHAPEQDGGPNE